MRTGEHWLQACEATTLPDFGWVMSAPNAASGARLRGGYRDPESQAFIESWLGKLKERCIWRKRSRLSTKQREVINAYVTH